MWKLNNLLAALIVSCTFIAFATPAVVRAADHGDAPNVDNDAGADIADLFMFRDPNDNTKVILVGTVHGFIVPGEAGNFGAFDPSVQYRFDLEQTGDAKPDASIIVTFSERTAIAPDKRRRSRCPAREIQRSGNSPPPPRRSTFPRRQPRRRSPPIPPARSNSLPAKSSDPFFFDIPAFQRFVASVQAGSPDATVFSRGRNSFAGYNVLGIAFSFPMDMIRGGHQ